MIPTDFGIENSNQRKYEEFDFFLPPVGGGGDLSHKYSSSFIFWKLLKFQLYLKLIIMHLVVVLVMSDSFVYRMHLQYALILNKFC